MACGSVVATVRRRGKVIIPNGNTILRAGDVLTVVSLEEELPDLAEMVSTHEIREVDASPFEYADK